MRAGVARVCAMARKLSGPEQERSMEERALVARALCRVHGLDGPEQERRPAWMDRPIDPGHPALVHGRKD